MSRYVYKRKRGGDFNFGPDCMDFNSFHATHWISCLKTQVHLVRIYLVFERISKMNLSRHFSAVKAIYSFLFRAITYMLPRNCRLLTEYFFKVRNENGNVWVRRMQNVFRLNKCDFFGNSQQRNSTRSSFWKRSPYICFHSSPFPHLSSRGSQMSSVFFFFPQYIIN